MNKREQSIIALSDKILDYLLHFKESNPDFTFPLRQRDSAQSKDVKRLEIGYWFQGSFYIMVPLFRKGDSAQKVKTIGFFVNFDKSGNMTSSSIKITFKAGKFSKEELLFHEMLASKFGIKLSEHNIGDYFFENPTDIFTNLHLYITEFRDYAVSLLKEYDLTNKYLVTEADFQKHLSRIDEIKLELKEKKMKDIRYWGLGFGAGEWYDRLNKFKTENYWQALDYDDTDTSPAAERARSRFNEIKEGDQVIIKGYGGTHDLVAHYKGEVVSININKKRINLKRTEGILYHGKAPSGGGAGNWRDTIIEIKREDVINLLFYDGKYPVNDPKTEGNIAIGEPKNKFPLNQILYGPPGTGKTYKLLNEYFGYFEVTDKTVSKKDFETEIITNLNWWQIIALILLEGEAKVPDIKKHRYIKYKLQVSNTKSLDQTAWGQLSSHTIEESKTVNYSRRMHPLIFDKTNKSIWKIIKSKEELIDDLIEIAEKIKGYKEDKTTSSNFKFVTFHQSYSYEDFIEGIKPVMDEESTEETSDVGYTIKKGVFYQCCNEAAKLAGFLGLKDAIENYSKQQRQEKFENAPPYGLFIDEINRGNVSQIFGELITLIEGDKRLGKSEIILDLPYSKNKFSVPPNLYIIGTMNTADRSVEALDTALRRRFCFEEMPPKYDLKEIQYTIAEYSVSEILKTINLRIEKLLDKDHAIGHSYFINKNAETIVESFYKNIIPLLQEYFFGDYGKLGLVLGKGFVRLKDWENGQDNFADFDSENSSDYNDKAVYEVIDYRKEKDFKLEINKVILEMDFTKAIQLLMNKKFD